MRSELGARRARRTKLLAIGLLTGLGGAPAWAGGAVRALASNVFAAASSDLTKEEALQLAFPECDVQHSVLYLTKAERQRAKELAGFDIGTSVVHAYIATREGKPVGTAWFDVHTVRTKKEVLMFVVDPEQRLQRLEVLVFTEPPEYQPRASWYAQFMGRRLDRELELDRGIKSVTGATLTARATTRAARRVLAIHRVALVERKAEDGASRMDGT